MHSQSNLPVRTAQEGISDAEAWKSPLSLAKGAESQGFKSSPLLAVFPTRLFQMLTTHVMNS